MKIQNYGDKNMCNCKNDTHCLERVAVTTTNVALTVTNSNNISSLECFNLFISDCKNVSDVVTGKPLPVQIVVNGTAVSLLNKYSLPILSNRVPRRAKGAYVVPASGTPYVILFTTPR